MRPPRRRTHAQRDGQHENIMPPAPPTVSESNAVKAV